MSAVKIIKNKKRRTVVSMDPKKECLIKELSLVAEAHGYRVRREHLKQGLGWKVVSGMCRKGEEKIIFVDRKLAQTEQVSFLLGRLATLRLEPKQELLVTLSNDTQQLLNKTFLEAPVV